MKALDRLALLLIGLLAGVAATVLTIGVSQLDRAPGASRELNIVGTVLAVTALGVAIVWTLLKKRQRSH